MKFSITTVSAEERQKADSIYNYPPAETILATFEKATEQQARNYHQKGVRDGKFPKDSELVFLD